MACGQFLHVVTERQIARYVAQSEIEVDRARADTLTRSDRFQFGAELKSVRADGVVKRLLAGAIACKKQRCGLAARSAIVNCKRKHAVETVQALLAPHCIRGEDDFSIAVAMKSASKLREFAAQFAKVVNLAVENNREAAIG